MLRDAFFIFLVTLAGIKGLYEFRQVHFIGKYLSTFTAVLLIYPAFLYTTVRKLPIRFFERNREELYDSLFWFAIATVVIFPPFLLANHLYQHFLFHRSFEWVPLAKPVELISTQIFLIAFPEEFFFRGYLQTAIKRVYPRWAIPIAAFLFAFSHSLIALRWWHFAIFFPGLVFGWLRQKTNGLVAPILFHAFCNVLVFWIGLAYQ